MQSRSIWKNETDVLSASILFIIFIRTLSYYVVVVVVIISEYNDKRDRDKFDGFIK